MQAFAHLDGNKIAERTCTTQQANVQQAGMWASVFGLFGQQTIGQQAKTDISGLEFTTVNSMGNAANVRVTGQIRVAVLALSQTQDVDETWQMAQEGGKWKWCGQAGTPMPRGSQAPPSSTGFTDLSASMPIDGAARFNFGYAGNSSRFRMDVSTLADMRWDVHLTFAIGTSSPLVEPSPTKWGKYSCGQTLSWRVISDNGVQSPIQRNIVTCN